METTTINLEPYYTNRAYYPYIPAPVFDALEAAFLEGKDKAEVPTEDYNLMMSDLEKSGICQKG